MNRDLSSGDPWAESLTRSRARRDAVAPKRFRLPARRLSLAALLLVVCGPVAGVAVAQVLGGAASEGAPEGGERGREVASVSGRHAARLPEAVSSATTSSAPAARVARPAPAARTTVEERRPTGGGGVEALQRALGVPVDGDFGARTERALRRWQRRHGLAVDGVAGPTTRAGLGLGGGPLLKRAASRRGARAGRTRATATRAAARPAHGSARPGGGVRALQQALGISADGVFGSGTEGALERWQRAHGLAADGVAGPQTRARLGLGAGPLLKRKRAAGRRRHRGGGSAAVQRVIAAADAIATAPYRYGGGHGSFSDSGYDCSGSVSYALHGGGLLSTPLDSSGFMSYGAPGPGRHVTIYANPGHVYMVVDGRRFDTSARYENGSRWTSTQRSAAGYTVRHPRGL